MASNCDAHCNFRLIKMYFYTIKIVCEWHSTVMSRAVRLLLLLLLLSSFACFLLIFRSKSRTRMRIQYDGLLGIACVLTEWAIMNKLQWLKRLRHQLGIINSRVFVASSQHFTFWILQTHLTTMSFSTNLSSIQSQMRYLHAQKTGLVYLHIYTRTSDERIFILLLLDRIIGLTAFRLEKRAVWSYVIYGIWTVFMTVKPIPYVISIEQLLQANNDQLLLEFEQKNEKSTTENPFVKVNVLIV